MDQDLEPLAVTINTASQITGEPRTKIYEGLKNGKLKFKKSGRRTLILYGSLQQYIANLPDGKLTPPRQPSPERLQEAEEVLLAVGLGAK